jgi:S1-C subfamily serine protease
VVIATTVLVFALVGVWVGYIVRGAPNTSSSLPPASTQQATTSTSSALSNDTVNAIVEKVEPGLVDVNTVLGYQDLAAAGTGMVIGDTGVVLTNNHVIDGATSITVTDLKNNKTYSATVTGYDLMGDVAVLQLQGAAGLATVPVGDSATVQPGDQVVALGNAGGTGGLPSVVTGEVTALDQSITAVDEASGASENLTQLIETNAAIQAGDSGGPLIDTAGKVVAMNTAASSGFLFGGGATAGYAIPIDVINPVIAQIEARTASSTVHIGPTAFLGVEVATFPNRYGSQPGTTTGVEVVDVDEGTPAQRVGLVPGDVIVSLNGQGVATPTALATAMQQLLPGDTVQLGWEDISGASHRGTVALASGPPA